MLSPMVSLAAHRHVVSLLEQRIAEAPRTTLLSCGSLNLTAEEMMCAAEVFAKALSKLGVKPGERVAMQCSNRPEFLYVLLGCALAGLVLVPINTASRGEQLAYYLRNSRARVFITEAALIANLQSVGLVSQGPNEELIAIWSLDRCDALASLPVASFFGDVPVAESLPAHKREGAAPGIVMYTSGTSGPSKGVICSHAQLYWWGQHSLQNIGIQKSDVLYTCLPLFHINALNTFYQALISGARMVVGPRFSVSNFFEDLKRSEATVTYLLGAMVPMLLSRKQDDSEKEHVVRIALAPGASAQHYEQFEQRTGISLLDGFGSTESNFVICTPIHDRRPGWMGKVVPGFEARVVDHDDNEVQHGTPGELLLRSDQPFAFSSGYFEMPEKTLETWRNLWLHTGDRVVRDESGYFRFLDRLKDSIRRRGENISSYEVEQVVGSHPCVADVAAYAVPSELAEDEVMCALVLKEGGVLDHLELIQWCEPRLPYFAVPRFLRVLVDLPKTENGKVQKYKLREQGCTPDTWDLASTGYKVKR